jgi:hypothetical protein
MGNTQSSTVAVRTLKKIYTERIASHAKKEIDRLNADRLKRIRDATAPLFVKVDTLVKDAFPWLEPASCSPHHVSYDGNRVTLEYIVRLPSRVDSQIDAVRAHAESAVARLATWEEDALKAVCSREGLPEFDLDFK